MADTKAKFEEFVSTCSRLLKGENPQFLALIKKRYDGCSETFRRSPEMADLLEVTRIKMLTDQKKLFVHLKDFVAELKAWGSKIKNEGKRKRKAESPLETVAKMSRMEDNSMSEGSDIEGKLQRALGAVFASPLLLSETASPSCPISGDASREVSISGVEKAGSTSAAGDASPISGDASKEVSTSGVEKAGSTSAAGDASVPPQEQAATLNGHTHSPRGETKASALHTVGIPESLKQSDAGSPNQGASSSSNGSAHGEDNLHVVTDAPEDSTGTVESNEEKNSSEVTARTVESSEERSFSEESASGTVKSIEEKAFSEVSARTAKSNEEKAYSEDSASGTAKSSEEKSFSEESASGTAKSNEEKSFSKESASGTAKSNDEKAFSKESATASGTAKSNDEKAFSEESASGTVESIEEKAYSEVTARTVKSNEEKAYSEDSARTVKSIEEKSFSKESASGTVKSNEEKACSEVTTRTANSDEEKAYSEDSARTVKSIEEKSFSEESASGTVNSNEEKAYSEDSARTVKSSEPPKCNLSVKSSEPDSDMQPLTTPAEPENCSDVHSVSDQRKHGAVDVQRRITLTPVQPKCPVVPKNSALTPPRSISKSNNTNSKVFSKPSNSNVTRKVDLSRTVDRLKDRLAASPLPGPPASPPLFDMTCDDPIEDDSDVIMIEDDDEEFGEASTVVTMKAAKSKSGRTETSSMSRFSTTVKPGPSAASSSSAEQALQGGSSPDVAEKASKEQKHVRRLEKLLEKIRDKIENICEKDLSIDDLDAEDSPYIFEDCLQKKFIKVWNKLCQIKGRNTSSGRPIERRFKYEGTRFPEINRKIQKFVNRPDCFPDYHDVKGIVKKVNTRCTLGLSAMQINDISREAFLDVGETLKKRRHEDFISTFHSKQTMHFSSDRDPALFDDELRRKLDENSRVGKSRLEEVINKYSNLQTQLAESGKKDSEGSHDEHSEGSGEGEQGKGQGASRVKVKETSSERDEEAEDSAAAESDSGAMIEMDVAEESDFLYEDDGGEPDHDTSQQPPDKSSATDSKVSKTNDSDSDSIQPDDKHYNKADSNGEQLSDDEELNKADSNGEQLRDDEELNNEEQLKDDGQLEKTGKEKDQDSNKSGSKTPQKVSRENHVDARQAADRFHDRSKVGKRVEACGQRGETGSKPWVSIQNQNSGIGNEVKHGGSSGYNSSHNGGSEEQSVQHKYSSLHNSRPVSGYLWHRRSPSSKFSFHNKSRSPVKISTSLKLPNFLVRRNGRLLPPKPETVFYPEKNHSFVRGVTDDASVTVICSSDEEDESGGVSVKIEPLVKREPDLCPREDDIIELSDSD